MFEELIDEITQRMKTSTFSIQYFRYLELRDALKDYEQYPHIIGDYLTRWVDFEDSPFINFVDSIHEELLFHYGGGDYTYGS